MKLTREPGEMPRPSSFHVRRGRRINVRDAELPIAEMATIVRDMPVSVVTPEEWSRLFEEAAPEESCTAEECQAHLGHPQGLCVECQCLECE